MTRPVRERSALESVARQGKQIDSLSKRPAQVSTGGTLAWCRISTNAVANINVLSGVNKLINVFNQTENTDATIFSGGSNSITVLVDGFYFLKAQTQWATFGGSIPTSIRESWIVVNNLFAAATASEISPLSDFVMVNGWSRLSAGDQAQLIAHQDSGSTDVIYGADDGGSTNANQLGNFLELVYIPLPLGVL